MEATNGAGIYRLIRVVSSILIDSREMTSISGVVTVIESVLVDSTTIRVIALKIALVAGIITIVHSILVHVRSLVTINVSILGNSSLSSLLLDVVRVFVADLSWLVNALKTVLASIDVGNTNGGATIAASVSLRGSGGARVTWLAAAVARAGGVTSSV
jgi:hypothetical protein